MSARERSLSSGDPLNEAAAWHGRLRASTPEESVWIEFTAWLETSDANRDAFDRLDDLYADLDEAADDIIPLFIAPAIASKITRLGAWRKRRLVQAGAAVALLAASLIIAVGLHRSPTAQPMTEYATRTGETKILALADGSTIELNTRSKVAVAFNARERRVRLNRGEAIFKVAKDPARPFIVTVGDWDVRDVGTVFNILRDGKKTAITVAEGEVSVSPKGSDGLAASDRTVRLSAGEQFVRADGGDATVTRVDPAAALAWRAGYLVYEDAPVSQVVDDLNRYFVHQISLKDSDVGSRRFSGVLKIDDETAVLERLTRFLPLAVDRGDNGSMILRAASPRN